ncbi:MAG: TolC family protein [Muribaculum sp.]|nr:TolC family protein [Muribaculum sp.]
MDLKKCAVVEMAMMIGAFAATAQAWDLEQCVDYALDHNITIKQRMADIESSEISVASAKSGYLPSVSAGVSQSWSLGRGLTAENTYANRNTSSTSWNASLNLPLFDGLSTPRQVSYAKANLAATLEQFEAAKENVTLNVITAYLQVLYNKELHEVAMNQVELSKYELNRQTALLEAGKIPEIDMLEAQSQLAQDELSAATSANDTRLSLLDLAQLLELDEIEGFDIQPLKDESMLLASPEDVYAQALNINHGLKAARSNIFAAERSISVAKSGYMPRLSFNAGIGSSYFTMSGADNEPFRKQMKNNYSTNFGLSLSIPIFDALSTHNSIRRAKVQHIAAQLQYEEAEQNLYKTIQQAYYQADGAHKRLKASETASATADAAFEAMREKYNIGRATPTEYEQAKTRALRAKAESIQAKYEMIMRTRILDFYARGF